MPPATTLVIGPHQDAVTPDSKPPSSLDAPMKTELTAETRPRLESGVRIWMSVWRMTTEMLSNAPVKTRAIMERVKDREKPKTMVARPKAATAQSRARPGRLRGGRWAWSMAMENAPMAGAAR